MTSKTVRREPMPRHSDAQHAIPPVSRSDEPGSGARSFVLHDLNLLHETPEIASDVSFVTWTGSLNADDLWTPEPRNWLGPGILALEEVLTALGDGSAGTSEIYLVPHARHVLSDAHGTRQFLDRWAHDRLAVRLALWPWGLFEPSMVEHAEDHLHRILETLLPYTDLLMLGSGRIGDDEVVDPMPLASSETDAILAASAFLEMLDAHASFARPGLTRSLWIGSTDEAVLNADRDLLRRHGAD